MLPILPCKLSAFALLVLSICGSAALAQNGYVGVYADAAGTTPCDTIPLGTGRSLYVVATLQGSSADGITGVEFRIETTNPTGWYITPSWNASVSLGDALGNGINLAYATCQVGTNGRVLLGTLDVFNAGGDSTLLLVRRHLQPSHAATTCALFVACDGPIFSQACMSSSGMTCALSSKAETVHRSQEDDVISQTALNGSGGDAHGGTATVASIATINGRLSVKEPWSPNQLLLAYQGVNGGLYVFDAAEPEQPSEALLANTTRFITWSPDGAWLLCQTQTPEQHRRMLSSLVAVPATGGIAVPVINNADIGAFTWSHDGNIYYWEKSGTHRRKSIVPPVAAAQSTSEVEPYVFLRGNSLNRFGSHLTPPEATLANVWQSGVYNVVPAQSFLDGERYLLNVYHETRGVFSAVTDVHGNVLTDFGNHTAAYGFSATTISFDAQHVVGFCSGDDGDNYLWSKLYVSDLEGTWRLPVTGGEEGIRPACARVGNLIAYENVFTGEIHVGTLVIDQ